MAHKNITFSIATCNVLYEPYYIQYVENTPISFVKRYSAFKKALDNDAALKNLDIICFQEWPVTNGVLRKQFEHEELVVQDKKIKKIDYFNKHAKKHTQQFLKALNAAYPTNDYYYLYDSAAQKDSVLTLISKHKFKLLSYKIVIFTPNKKMIIATITPHSVYKPITIINAHLPFNRKNSMPKEFDSMKNEIAQLPQHQPLLICGDFNYTVLHTLSELNTKKYATLQTIFTNMQSSAEYNPQPTSTSGKSGFNLNDFIFFNKQIVPESISIYPKDYSELLRHTEAPAAKVTFFSDHSISRMKCTITL